MVLSAAEVKSIAPIGAGVPSDVRKIGVCKTLVTVAAGLVSKSLYPPTAMMPLVHPIITPKITLFIFLFGVKWFLFLHLSNS